MGIFFYFSPELAAKIIKMNISIVGCGNVGEAVGFLLVNKCQDFTLNIMEPDDKKKGKWLELMHITGLNLNGSVVYNNQAILETSEWVFYTAGAGIKIGQDRREVLKENVILAKDIFSKIHFKTEPYIIVMTNPVDAVTYFVRKFTGLGRLKVIGTGTSIDAARFSFNLFRAGLHNKVENKSKQKPERNIVLGEHGKSMVPLFSQTGIVLDPSEQSMILEQTVNAALEVKEFQDATYTCVASCAVKLMEMIVQKTDDYLCFNTAIDDDLKEFLEIQTAIDFSWYYRPVDLHKASFKPNNREWVQLKKSAKDLEKLIESVAI